ncbi:MAG: hypothetical protein NWE83_08440 [Candidatus Bathyarchaeota archaeon]|nr:hypothetical protein [Candidatus Bathyarchaeota archaeon]
MSRPIKRKYQRFKQMRPRGRPRGRLNLYDDVKTIVKIADQFDLHPHQLATSLIQAWKKHSASCGPLTIYRRSKNQNAIIVMISHGEQIVSQFSVHLDILRNTEYYIR